MRLDEIVNFTNIDDEEFIGEWNVSQSDGVRMKFKPGETKQILRFLAEHFANHLADRILLKQGKGDYKDEDLRKPLIQKMIGEVKVEIEETETIKIEEPLEEKKPQEEQEEFEELKELNKSSRPKARRGRKKKTAK